MDPPTSEFAPKRKSAVMFVSALAKRLKKHVVLFRVCPSE